MKARTSATSWSDCTVKTGSLMKRSMESTLPSCKKPKPAALEPRVVLKPVRS